MRPKYFKLNGRYYVALCTQFQQGTPDTDLGVIIFDVTGLPDTSKVKEVARIRYPQRPGGFHNLFPYKHSDGRVLLFTTNSGSHANVYDMDKLLHGDKDHALIDTIPVPQGNVRGEYYPGYGLVAPTGFHDFFIGYDPATRQDKFYGAGGGGCYVYDVTNVGKEAPKMITSIVGPAGVVTCHTFTPTPDGKFAVVEVEYQWAPLRIFDLRPGLEGKVQAITQPVSVWNWDWNDLPHNMEVRWPYVFVSSYEDGLEVLNMQDPAHPRTVAWYYTCDCNHLTGYGGLNNIDGHTIYNGAFGVMVRNTDGLILITDVNTGAWFFKMDGFNGWNGADWAMPNVSSAQDWDYRPSGAPATPPSPQAKRVTTVAAAPAYPDTSAQATRAGADAVAISVNIRVQNNLEDPAGLTVSLMERSPGPKSPQVLGTVPAGDVRTFTFNTSSFGPNRPASESYRLGATADRPRAALASSDFTLNTAPPTDTLIWSVRDGTLSFRMKR
jgi:hypothetical protein